MGWMTRFEPATSGSTDRRSNQLSYIHHKSSIVIILIFGRFCQKTFRRAFANPAEPTNNPLIKSAAAGHKNPTRHAIPSAHAPPTGHAPNAPIPPGARSAMVRHANPAAPGVAPLFSRRRRLRGGQVAQALAHLVLCQHPFFRRPQAHL